EWQAALGDTPLTAEELALLAEAKRPLVRLRGRWVTVDPGLVQRLRRRRPRPLAVTEALAAALSGSIEIEGERVAIDTAGPLDELLARLRTAAAGEREA